jgi:hypothetical protein
LNLPASKTASVHRSVLEQRGNAPNKRENESNKNKPKNDKSVNKSANKTQQQESERLNKIRDGRASTS